MSQGEWGEEWKIAGKIPVKGLSCCPDGFEESCIDKIITNSDFLSSLDELIGILFHIFSEDGNITRKDKNFFESLELIKKVLAPAKIHYGKIIFSFPKKINEKMPNLPKHCFIELKPGNPTVIYGKWMSE